MKIKITADSACDLGKELCEKYDVAILPLKVILGEETFIDGVNIVPQDIFDYVATTDNLPKTAAVTAQDCSEFFTEQLKDADVVIYFSITSKASSSYNNACVAAKDFKGKVFVIDSLALSTGEGLLVLKACDLAKQGMAPADIVKTVEGLRPLVNTSFVPDALDYLHKGGRCSLAALMGAKVLKLHPMIDIKDGQMYAKKKYMGNMDRCIRRYVEELAEEYPSYDKTRCFITHSSCDAAFVQAVKTQVENLFSFDEILETVAGNVVTSHCGQGTLGVLFITV
jgi:DegV family protein with EDD domain